MEKISALIDKLQELKNSNAGLQSISYYVQLLQAEILHARNLQREQERVQERQDSHVAVIMPSTPLTTTASPSTIIVEVPVTTSSRETLPENKQTAPAVTSAPAAESTLTLPLQNTSLPKPVAASNGNGTTAAPVNTIPAAVTAETTHNGATAHQMPSPAPASQPAEQAPADRKPAFITIYGNTETQQPVNTPPAASEKKPETNGVHKELKELKELNQLVAQNTPSLNDRWKQSQTEVADRLSETPVKDLRQAIGINDKFQFIQELFRGDVDTYERSVKTINELHTLQEAEYWIERELKIRQGWVDDNRAVRQFYNLVKKRFS
ncbi:hypothetical protein [Chitinophaga sp. S165]|uniref:hypothetical protein n=1 Tax=Chitinophaga sp. S165 TaxID=2135462 RepID=UPI000D713EF6|nr:hypothetical protein [Chitinophaga sp. S165]PWV45179.1 hypothetical protein C7475_11532 [Chitinophaga sp. S165]